MIITIPKYRCPSRNKTVTSHWRTYQRYRDEIAELIKAYKPRGPQQPFTRAVVVTITAFFKGKRHIDVSNIDDKLIIDGLMHAGIIEDDDAYHNRRVIKEVCLECGEDALTIEIE